MPLDLPESDSEQPVVAVEVTTVDVEMPSLETRIEWIDDWEESTREARKLARRDSWYHHNIQWTKEDTEKLKRRKQPVLTKNRIARKIHFILGEEIKKRIDPCARPRTPQHEDSARAATDALRYAKDEEQFDQVRSAVLKNILIEGYGGALKEMEEDEGEYRHVLRHIEWDRIAYDPHSRAPDFSDAKWLAVVVWMDLDDAIIDHHDAAEALREAVDRDISGSDETTEDTPRKWADRKRKRVKFVEMFFRIGRDWFRSVFTAGADIEECAPTVYLDEKGKHSVCPLVLASCYVDPDGNRYGVVRQLISPQDEINKRSSKALHLLSMRQVIAERDAIIDPKKFQQELAKPDGFAEVEVGRLADGSVQISQTGDLANGQIMLLQEAKNDIDAIGPSSATMPDIPESASGRAFIARQQSASQELGTIFDQLRTWTKQVFALDWLCIRQFWTEQKWLRITDDKELTGYRFVHLNRPVTRAQRLQELLAQGAPLESALAAAAGEFAPLVLAQAQQAIGMIQQQAGAQGMQPPDPRQQMQQIVLGHPLLREQITVNQVDQMLVDIVLDESPDTAIIAQEEFSTLSEIMPTLIQSRPDLAPAVVKMLIKASQLRDKKELLEQLDKAPDPQQAQMQQEAAELGKAMQQAGIAVAQTKAQLQQAQTAKTAAEAQAVPLETQAKAQSQQAQAMSHAAMAGSRAAPQGVY